MTRRRRVGAVLAIALLLAAGCGWGDDGDDGDDRGASTTGSDRDDRADGGPGGRDDVEEHPEPVEVAEDDDLYEVPDPLPAGDHGDLLRYQRVTPSLIAGATTWRVMYLSESIAGDPIPVTGMVLVPDGDAPDDGRLVLTLAHGTTGIADECAPSKEGAAEAVTAIPAIDRGWVVAITDYEGLGTPGRHPYLVGESEGRGVLDAVLAAGDLPDADTGTDVLIGGYSQGGHGALWANQIAEDWTPGIDVLGTFAGAPATEIPVILSAASLPGVSAFALMVVAGFAAAYPEADPALVLTDEGVDHLDVVDQGCTDAVRAALAALDGPIVREGAASVEPWATLAAENDPGQVATGVPVLIAHSDGDGTVPPAFSAMLVARMCEVGQVVERRVLAGAGGHVEAAPDAYRQAYRWFGRLLAGDPPVDDCS